QKVALALQWRERFQLFEAINAVTCFFQDICIDVTGKNSPAPRYEAQRISKRDRNTVRFFSGRRRRTPDTIFTLATTCVFGEHREMVPLPKERGQIGGQGVNKCLPFRAVLVSLQQTEIVTEI